MGSEEPAGTTGQPQHLSEDEALLHKLGYAQELYRAMGGFGNFAISFTIISILAGCLTSYFIAFNNGGPVAVTWGWLLVGGFCIIVALAMAEIASSMPTAGGLYYWASKLGSPGWGWFTGWFNLVGQISVTAAIDYGAATFCSSLLNLWFDMSLTKENVFIVFTVIILLHLAINLAGLNVLNLLNTISAWWHMAGVVVIVLILIVIPDNHQSASFVFTETINNSGFSGDRLREPDLLVRVRHRAADGAVHDHGLRRLGAPQRGDEGRGARRRARHRDVGRRLGDLRLHPARRRDVRRDRRRGHARGRRVRRAVHLGDGDERQLGRVHARHRLRRAAVLRRGVGDIGLAHAVRVLARRRRAGTPDVAPALARAHAGVRRRRRSACSRGR